MRNLDRAATTRLTRVGTNGARARLCFKPLAFAPMHCRLQVLDSPVWRHPHPSIRAGSCDLRRMSDASGIRLS